MAMHIDDHMRDELLDRMDTIMRHVDRLRNTNPPPLIKAELFHIANATGEASRMLIDGIDPLVEQVNAQLSGEHIDGRSRLTPQSERG